MNLKTSALLASLALAAGCQTVTPSPDPLQEPPRAGQSVAVVSITGNTAQVTAIDGLSVQRVTGPDAPKEYHTMKQVAPGLARDTSLFVAVLPEGDYELNSFHNSQTRRSLTFSPGMRSTLGRFTVRAGQPVDLGRLIMTPVNTRVIVGRSARETSNVAMMKRFAAEHARLFEGSVAPGWTAPRTSADRVEEYALARPVGADNPREARDGTLYAASRLGSVLARSPGGRWRVLHAEGLESLLYAMPVDAPDTELLAVGEFNTLARLPRGGSRLVRVDPGDLPPGNVLFIAGSDATGWYVAHQQRLVVNVFRSAKLEGGQWRALRSENVAASIWSGANPFWIWPTPRGLAYAMGTGSLHFLDFATGAWTSVKAPNDHRLLQVAVNPTGSIGILTSPGGGFGGIFSGLYLTRDEGRSWQEVKTEFSVKIAAPRETAKGTLLLPGGVFSNPELHASRDGGKTWQKASDFSLDRTLHAMTSGAMLAVDLGQSGLFAVRHSGDEGATWSNEYSNFDRAAYEADQRNKK